MLDVLDAAPEIVSGSFFDLLTRWQKAKRIGTDDILAAVLPLFEQVRRQHEQNNIAPLDGVDRLKLHDDRELWFNVAGSRPDNGDLSVLTEIEAPESDGVDVTESIDVYEGADWSYVGNRRIAERGQRPDTPLYFLDYTCWEMAVGAHDALADLFALGMILGSLATRLDFTQREDLQRFLSIRRNVHAEFPDVHPVVSRVIRDMTEVRREDRTQDLAAIIEMLDDYRRSETDDFEERIARLEQIEDPAERRQQIQLYLRNRLFEISRRNRLLFFKESNATANLSIGSLPFLLDHRSIRADQLLVTTQKLCRNLEQLYVSDGAASRMPRFEDYPFLGPTLDKIRLQARNDIKEYGFSQLRLVMAFLRWHNFSGDRNERIHSPLILLPVEMRKQTGTEHGFEISPEVSLQEAEINPVLRHQLREVYGIELDETIDLTNFGNVKELHSTLENAIQKRQSGVSVHIVEKPRIQLIRRTVQRQLDDYNRRRKRTGKGLRDYGGYAYSYDPDNMVPLGLTLFNAQVRVNPAPGREFVGKGRPGEVEEKETRNDRETTTDFYSIDQGQDGDPLNWEIDLTSIMIANFNYRKMSLVRDYASLKDGRGGTHTNFQNLFNAGVRAAHTEADKPSFGERYAILPHDPSQEEAVLRARTGTSYVIQGPPGTGKSQTIANLLADFASRGKKVLFVCEKRVALDVVFHRLAEAGLSDLTCLIHDTKSDKKAFINELKRHYESWRDKRVSEATAKKRAKLVGEVDEIVAELEAFSREMSRPAAGAGETELLRRVIERAVAHDATRTWLDGQSSERLPDLRQLNSALPALHEMELIAAPRLPAGILPQALLRYLRTGLAHRDRLLGYLGEALPAARAAIGNVSGLTPIGIKGQDNDMISFGELIQQTILAEAVEPLARAGKIAVFDKDHPEHIAFQERARRLERRAKELARAEAEMPWTSRPSVPEADAALRIAQVREGKLLSFIYSDWRKLKRWLASAYNGEILSFTILLEQLKAQHDARAEYDREIADAAATYGHDDLKSMTLLLDRCAGQGAPLTSGEAALVRQCITAPEAVAPLISSLAAGNARMTQAAAALGAVLQDHEAASLREIGGYLDLLDGQHETAVQLLRAVVDLEESSPDAVRAWRELSLDATDLERATLLETIARSYKASPVVAKLGSAMRRAWP